MRKFLIYFIGFFTLFFILPVIFTVSSSTKEPTQDVVANTDQSDGTNKPSESTKNQQYDYQKYSTIKLLHTSTSKLEELNIDEYLYGVVASEMPASFEIEALKAQATVARTYTIYQIIHDSGKHDNADMCDDFNCCQAWISKEERMAKWNAEEAEGYWKKIVEAVDSTKGKIVAYNGQPINAFFHANSGGVTESSLNIWGE